MSLKLNTRMAGRQTVTPQLAQSIRLLQLNTQDLLAELSQTLATNVMLERDDDGVSDDNDVLDMDAALAPAEADDTREWDDHMADLRSGFEGSGSDDYADQRPRSVQAEVLEALQAECLHPGELSAALAVLEAVDDNGRLEQTLETLSAQHDITQPTLRAALTRVRALAPAGYAAATLEECLLLQLDAMTPSSRRDDAVQVVKAGLLAVGRFGPEGLRRKLGFDETRFADALGLLRTLDFHPGRQAEPAEAITPDLIVLRRGGDWRVELHPAATPRLRINRHCEQLLAGCRASGGALRGQLQDARWLLRGLEMRNDTLLKTGCAILRHQFGFLTGGDEALRPLKLREVATMIGMHESTVSRVTSGKYVQTPRGLYELRHFFSVTLRGDEDASAASAKALIRRLVDSEPAGAPLCDSQITRELAAQGIHVVRRTVAKYREGLGIPPATLRRLTAARSPAARSA